MPRIAYIEKNLGARKIDQIAQVVAILDDYAAQGFTLTVRQVFYQLVASARIENTMRDYKNLVETINDGRLTGLIDWDRIVDRTRTVRDNSHWDDPSEIIETAQRSFRIDRWKEQPVRCEVFVEKDAVVGIPIDLCQRYDVPLFSCRGNTSQTAMWQAAMRIVERYEENEQQTVILHLGDHDPNGIDMTRDITDRLALFCGEHGVPAPEVRRLALNLDQVRALNPPANPAKLTDSRAKKYVAQFGINSWELDALPPAYLLDLIERAIEDCIHDPDAWERAILKEEWAKGTIGLVASHWGRVARFVTEVAS